MARSKFNVLTHGLSGLVGDMIVFRQRGEQNCCVRKTKAFEQDKTAADVLIEEGAAVQSANGLDWVYTTTAINAEVPGSKITFTAKDLPGNETVLEKMVI